MNAKLKKICFSIGAFFALIGAAIITFFARKNMADSGRISSNNRSIEKLATETDRTREIIESSLTRVDRIKDGVKEGQGLGKSAIADINTAIGILEKARARSKNRVDTSRNPGGNGVT